MMFDDFKKKVVLEMVVATLLFFLIIIYIKIVIPQDVESGQKYKEAVTEQALYYNRPHP